MGIKKGNELLTEHYLINAEGGRSKHHSLASFTEVPDASRNYAFAEGQGICITLEHAPKTANTKGTIVTVPI